MCKLIKPSRFGRGQIAAMLVMASIIGLFMSSTSFAQEDSVSEASIVYFVLLDDSASMQRRPENPTAVSWRPKVDEVKRQMATFITSLPNGTDVRFYAFAEELTGGPEVVISSDADREKLSAFVNALRAEGRETRLWRSLDSVMAEAAELATSDPGARVRVLAYSDLLDNDPNRPRPSTVLAKYRTLLRQSQVQLTYITIGFELQAEQRTALEDEGVQVRTALTPEDVIPLQAEFRIVPTEVLAGDRVTLVDDSIGVIRDRIIDWGDGEAPSRGRSPTHVYREPGEYTVRLTVTSSTGREDSATQRVKVVLPPPPVAAFTVSAEQVDVGTSVLLVNESTGADCRFNWVFGDARTSAERNPRVIWSRPGEYVIRLTAADSFGRQATAERVIQVEGPEQPVASFVVGTPEPRVGEAVVLTDTSTGDIETVTWHLPGRDTPLVVDYGNGGERSIECAFAEVGEQEVRLQVRGRGGEAETIQKLNVRTRFVPPEPAVTLEVIESGRDYKLVAFNNRSTGSVVQSEYDFGDGSPTVRVSGVQDVRHEYGPGNYVAHVRIIGPKEFAAEVVEIPIRVPKPLPAWVWRLLWLVPAAIVLLGGAAYAVLWWRKRQEDLRLSMLVGTLNYKSKDAPLAPYASVEFDGTATEGRVPLNESTAAVVRATSDPLTNQIEHSVEVVDGDGTQIGPVPLTENDRTTVGEYEFNLVQT